MVETLMEMSGTVGNRQKGPSVMLDFCNGWSVLRTEDLAAEDSNSLTGLMPLN